MTRWVRPARRAIPHYSVTADERPVLFNGHLYFYLFVGCFSSLSQVEPALGNFEQNNFVVIII